jgi:NADH dehydrogenase/NADH:ubiquinone oxidoreductase subunit G
MGMTNPLSKANLQLLEVLHLIGEAIPDGLSPRSFVLYQNIFQPASGMSCGLVLPTAAFTEMNGTFTQQAGEMHHIHKAVPAPGDALPSWQILCLLAQKLGATGFEYQNAEQIRAEMESMHPVDVVADDILLKLFQPDAAAFPLSHTHDHGYMGYPLGTWVKGLQWLLDEAVVNTER